MNDKLLSSLEAIIPKKEVNNLKEIVIIQNDNNSYVVYDKYVVEKNKKGSYKASKLGTFTENNFYKLKNAVAWCSFDKRKLYKSASRLIELDRMIWAMDTEIELHLEHLKNSVDTNSKLIYISKLTENRYKRKQYSNELLSFISDFDRYQTSLFNEKPVY